MGMDIEEEVISFETAKLAKKKGFIAYSEKFYTDVYGLCIYLDGGETLSTEKNGVLYDVNGEFNYGNEYEAPTQSLLAKWLRDHHNILIEVQRCFHFDDYANTWLYQAKLPVFDTRQIKETIIVRDKNNNLNFKTYEEALEKSLYDALNLIEGATTL